MSTTIVSAGSFLGNCRVAYNNLAFGLSPTVTSEASGYEATRAMDWMSYNKWKAANSAQQNFDLDLSSAQTVDCFGLYKHNLGSVGGSLDVQYSTGSAGGPYSSLFAITPGPVNSGGNRTLFRINSNGVLAQWWRFSFSGHSAAPSAGVIFLGASVQLPAPNHPFQLPIISPQNEVLNNDSEGGELLGRSLLRQGRASNLRYRLAEQWIRPLWQPFAEAAELTPFFFAWDATRWPDEAYFCFTDKKPKQGKSDKPNHVEVELAFLAK